jgi:benzoate/toluate 1,2-dioxygenase reductase subunit
MSYQIALTFEDGVTRFIECRPDETVADASYRARINIPLDCRDGACGTCKSYCESGQYDLGFYIEDAMTEEEAAEGYILTCQMKPQTDCIIQIPATSDVAKTGVSSHTGKITEIDRMSETTMGFSVTLDNRGELGFLPGQYVNVVVPGSDQTRSYSFSSSPQAPEVSFLIRNTPSGAMSTYLRDRAKAGDALEFHGPLGSFYLRQIKRPLLFLAGGTGLAPFLAMMDTVAGQANGHPTHLIYGVTRDIDLVKVDELEDYAKRTPGFTFTCCVAEESSSYPNKGYVTRYIEDSHVNGGDVDVYLCGPPPMVDAVRNFFRDQGITPLNFYFEKFANTGVVTEIGEEHLDVAKSDSAFDARLALELSAAQLTVGRLSQEQLARYRQLAEATAPHIQAGRFADVEAFRQANAAFHSFLIEATGIPTLLDSYKRLGTQDFMARALTPDVAVSQDIIKDHLDIVGAFERADLNAVQEILTAHNERSKATMRAGIERAGGRV